MPDNASRLWMLRNPRGRFVECVTRFVGHDVVVEIMSDGVIVIAHRFGTGTEAVAWAEEMRAIWHASSSRSSCGDPA